MGLLDKMIDPAAKKVLIDAAGEAISKTAGAVMEHQSARASEKSLKARTITPAETARRLRRSSRRTDL